MIFVFGSNLAGKHGKGGALYAKTYHGAIHGRGRGLQGNSYAIPTKGYKLEVLPLSEIQGYVSQFCSVVLDNPQEQYEITRIGCGLAGYKWEQIEPFFDRIKDCKNIKFI